MKDFVKTLDDLPRIVKFILVLIGDLFANVYADQLLKTMYLALYLLYYYF